MAIEPYKLEIEIIPGILEKEWSEIEKKIEAVKGFARTIHIDLIDGKFADDMTWMDPTPFAKYTQDMVFEVHMLVEDPIQYLKPFADAGFRRFIGHIEKMPDVAAFVAEGELYGEVGLAIDGPTTLEKLTAFPEDLDMVLIYTADQAGFSHKPFMSERLEKVKKLRAQAAYLPIEIDGGVSPEAIAQAQQAGATRFVTTGFLFESGSPETQFELLVKAVAV